MDKSEIIRSNARVILPHVRGKAKDERKAIYALISGGPIGLMAQIASSIVVSQAKMNVEVSHFEAAYQKVSRDINRGPHLAMNNDRRFRL